MAKRKTQWIDAVQQSAVAVPATSITEQTLVTETELENVAGGATLIRIVGRILTFAVTANATEYGLVIWKFP